MTSSDNNLQNVTSNIEEGINQGIDLGVNEGINVTNPTNTIFYFLVITSIYTVVNTYMFYSKTDSNIEVYNNNNNNILLLIYIGLLLLGTYFINITISKALCISNAINWGKILFITMLPWFLIFGVLYYILQIWPGWINPFSNTIGYLVVKILGVSDHFKKIMAPTEKMSGDSTDKNSSLIEALNNIEKNYAMFINEFPLDLDEFNNYIDELQASKIIKDNVEEVDITKIYQHINAKNFIGKMVWYLLAGVLISTVSYNFILNITCEKTTEESNQEYKILQEKAEYMPIYGKKWKQVTSKDNMTNLSESSLFIDLIDKYADRFINNTDNEIEFSKMELRYVGINQQLPQNIYIEINGNYYVAIE
tara:strand:+ start:2659 stop:3750 length:1092 start_codon:yes stop_codon:yes gene_type:complete